MSACHQYFAVDWSRIPGINEIGNLDDLFEAMDEEPMADWIFGIPFGPQVDGYFFSSWAALMEFKDWMEEAAASLDSKVVEEFSSIFKDAGLLMDDDFAFVPIREDVDVEDDWLLGAIPPAKVTELIDRMNRVDHRELVNAFQSALDRHPSELIESGEFVLAWFQALKEGLLAVSARGYGIILGAA